MTEETNTTITNEYKGFSLFNDVEDLSLRLRNRAVVMTNIAEGSAKNRRISPNGMGLIMGYFNQIPKEDRKELLSQFVSSMKERGFELTVA